MTRVVIVEFVDEKGLCLVLEASVDVMRTVGGVWIVQEVKV